MKNYDTEDEEVVSKQTSDDSDLFKRLFYELVAA